MFHDASISLGLHVIKVLEAAVAWRFATLRLDFAEGMTLSMAITLAARMRPPRDC